MNRQLFDTTFLLYVRIDSKSRKENLKLVINHIKKEFKTNIFLLEVDSTSQLSRKFVNDAGIYYKFIKDGNPVFHTTKYRNILVNSCSTPYFFICDADIIFYPIAILESLENLRNTKDPLLVYPYNGDVYSIPQHERNEYFHNPDFRFLKKQKQEFPLYFKYSVGGIFGGRVLDFTDIKLDNEKIYGWGPDDKERFYRLRRSGFLIYRSDYPVFHLHHDRNENSSPFNIKLMKKNEIEYFKALTCDSYR